MPPRCRNVVYFTNSQSHVELVVVVQFSLMFRAASAPSLFMDLRVILTAKSSSLCHHTGSESHIPSVWVFHSSTYSSPDIWRCN